MAKTKVFASFDYKHDLDMKNNLITQSKRSDSPFSIKDLSLNDKTPDWQQKARESIQKCDVFVVLLRENTHLASGVLREVIMAKQLNKRRFQLREKGRNPKPLNSAGIVIAWTWNNLKKEFGPLKRSAGNHV
ncbi:hypothetical protein ACFLWF_01630 [Chloroflexota bacterium]